ncbi:MAG: CHAT domain-containing protein, partial [Bacteroidota bacterium]
DTAYLQKALNTYETLVYAEQFIRQQDVSLNAKVLLSQQVQAYYDAALDLLFSYRDKLPEVQWSQLACFFMEANKSRDLQEFLQDRRAQAFANLHKDWKAREDRIRTRIDYYKRKIREEAEAGDEADPLKIEQWLVYLAGMQKEWARYYQELEREYPEYFTLRYASPETSLDELSQNMRAGEGWLEYFWGKEAVYGLGILNKVPRMIRVPRDEAEAAINAFLPQLYNEGQAHAMSNDPQSIRSFTQSSHQLFSLFVAPLIGPDIPQSLRIVPDGRLSLLPFSVFCTRPQTDTLHYAALPYLIQSSSIQYALSVHLALKQRPPSTRRPTLAGFAPKYPGTGRQIPTRGGTTVLQALPHNGDEVDGILHVFSGEKFDQDLATEGQFKQLAANFELLHLAMHAFASDSDPLASWLAFSPPNQTDSTEDGRLYAYEIFRLPLKAHLTVLSACNTGIGAELEGEGQVSLARAFAYAGCPSLVMTLWEAEDAAARGLMQRFYQNLAAGADKDLALRMAKMRFMRESGTPHPFYWAHFVSMGDPSPVVKKGGWFW